MQQQRRNGDRFDYGKEPLTTIAKHVWQAK